MSRRSKREIKVALKYAKAAYRGWQLLGENKDDVVNYPEFNELCQELWRLCTPPGFEWSREGCQRAMAIWAQVADILEVMARNMQEEET